MLMRVVEKGFKGCDKQEKTCQLTSLKANGKPKTPAPMNEINMFANILTGLLEPGPVLGPAAILVISDFVHIYNWNTGLKQH